nr:hypothetical protein CFP56_25947 [Quercus suber]
MVSWTRGPWSGTDGGGHYSSAHRRHWSLDRREAAAFFLQAPDCDRIVGLVGTVGCSITPVRLQTLDLDNRTPQEIKNGKKHCVMRSVAPSTRRAARRKMYGHGLTCSTPSDDAVISEGMTVEHSHSAA